MSAQAAGGAGAGLIAGLLVFAACSVLGMSGGEQCDTGDEGSSVSIDVDAVQASDELGLSADQMRNAALILNAATDLGIEPLGQAQKVAVMTALGESSLVNVDYGDDRNGVRNPDGSLTCSLGLFQQQWCLGWGTREQVMDPTYAATAFLTRLQSVPGWDSMAPTLAAHKVQRNADAYHYEKYEEKADAILKTLAVASTGATCPSGQTGGSVTTDGWTHPIEGARITSSYGMRLHPIDKVYRLHAGTDLAGTGCGAPIYAAADGTVIAAGGSGSERQRDLVRIDHGGGITTGYMHMYGSGIFVSVGQHVTAGEQIAEVGSAGSSTACHLHFETSIDGKTTDPVPFMAERGVTLP